MPQLHTTAAGRRVGRRQEERSVPTEAVANDRHGSPRRSEGSFSIASRAICPSATVLPTADHSRELLVESHCPVYVGAQVAPVAARIRDN